MNGPEHYREAERLIEEANHVGHSDSRRGDGLLLAAQTHAMLALAAATALTGYASARYYLREESDIAAWHEAAGVKPEPAAQVRIDSLSLDDVVRHPDLFEGNDICIVEVLAANEALAIAEGHVRVRYRFSIGSTYHPCSLDVPADTLVTPLPTA